MESYTLDIIKKIQMVSNLSISRGDVIVCTIEINFGRLFLIYKINKVE